MLVGIPWFLVDKAWQDVERYVEKGIRPSGEDVPSKEIKEKCKMRDYQLWVLVEDEVKGAGVSYLAIEDGELIAWVYALSGNDVLPSIKQIMNQFKDWAKYQGATKIRLRGRLGWKRIFPESDVKERFLEIAI